MIIRNLPSRFDLESEDGSELKSMIKQVSTAVSIDQKSSVCRIKLISAGRARKVVDALNRREFHGKQLSVSEGQQPSILGLFFVSFFLFSLHFTPSLFSLLL